MSYIQGQFCVTIIVILCIQILFTSGAKRGCECGRTRSYREHSHRIVNGRKTKPHEYPWMALLLHKSMAYCGGSVINSYYILTAAHCTIFPVQDTTVALGVHDRITMDNGRAMIYKVAKIIVHPGHVDRGSYDENDIALLKLQKKIKLTWFIRPVCLPYKDEEFNGRSAIVSGWGRKENNGFSDRFLQEVTVQILTRQQCNMSKLGNFFKKMEDQLLCAYQRDADACQGDSGGPLVTRVDPGVMVQVGVVSFGKLCADRSSPGAYAKVAHYLDWIFNMTRDAAYCRKPAYTPVRYAKKMRLPVKIQC